MLRNEVKFNLSCEKSFYFSCKKKVIFSLISAVKLGKCLRNGEIVFLAKLELLNEDIVEFKNILVVSDFPNVFLEELLVLQLER